MMCPNGDPKFYFSISCLDSKRENPENRQRGKKETSDKSPSSSNCIALCSVHSRHVVGHPLDCGHIGVHGPLGRGVHVATRVPHREVHKAEAGSRETGKAILRAQMK